MCLEMERFYAYQPHSAAFPPIVIFLSLYHIILDNRHCAHLLYNIWHKVHSDYMEDTCGFFVFYYFVCWFVLKQWFLNQRNKTRPSEMFNLFFMGDTGCFWIRKTLESDCYEWQEVAHVRFPEFRSGDVPECSAGGLCSHLLETLSADFSPQVTFPI